MKRILAGLVVATVMAIVMGVTFAEEAAINPIRVTTRQINAYGPNPIQIQGTNLTVSAAQLNAAAGGSTAALTPTTIAVSSTAKVTGAFTAQSTANIAGAVTCSNTLSVAGATTLTGGFGGTGWVVTNTFAAGVYTQRIFYAVGNVVTNMTILP